MAKSKAGGEGTMSPPNALCALVIPNVGHGMGDWRANAHLFWKAVGVAGWWHFLFISPRGTKSGCRARGHVIPTSCPSSWAMDPESLLLLGCHKHIRHLQTSEERWQVSRYHCCPFPCHTVSFLKIRVYLTLLLNSFLFIAMTAPDWCSMNMYGISSFLELRRDEV